VIPKDPAYFADTIPVTIKNVTGNNITETTINLEVFERLHRILFFVKEKSGNQNPVSGALISICDGQGNAASNTAGKVELNFKNISVDNLTMKVSGPDGSNYIPKYVTFKNEESETLTTLPTVFLEKGIPLSGKVLLNGQPTSKARVYSDMKCVSGMDFSYANGYSYTTKSIFEAEVHSDGTFIFYGLPPEVNNKDVPVYAIYNPMESVQKNTGQNSVQNVQNMLQTNQNAPSQQTGTSDQTYVGENKFVHIPAQQPLVLNITAFPNMKVDNIWGFPLQLTKLEQLPNNHIMISGIVKLKNFSPGFDIINEENIQFKVNDLEMQKAGSLNA
jgi:hypothetical protein